MNGVMILGSEVRVSSRHFYVVGEIGNPSSPKVIVNPWVAALVLPARFTSSKTRRQELKSKLADGREKIGHCPCS
jgi:hypothetical protein